MAGAAAATGAGLKTAGSFSSAGDQSGFSSGSSSDDHDQSSADLKTAVPETESLSQGTEYGKYSSGIFSKYNVTEKQYDERCSEDVADCNDYEKRSVWDYTDESASNPYTYHNINKKLRSPETLNVTPEVNAELEKRIAVITDILDRKTLKTQAKVYRGIDDIENIFGKGVSNMSPEEIIEKFSGMTYTENAFCSTSCSPQKAQEFNMASKAKYIGLLTIRTPKGTKGMYVGNTSSFGQSEQEVLLQQGTFFSVDKISYDPTIKQFHITMTARGTVR